MRCAPEWRNLISTSGKGLKPHIITVPLYQMTLTSIGTFEEPEKLENPEQPEKP